MSKVTVTYYDPDSFLIEECIKRAKSNYGNSVQVKMEADSDNPIDVLHFAIQRLITGDHLQILYDSGPNYQIELKKLRAEMLFKIGEVLDEVLMENEQKLTV